MVVEVWFLEYHVSNQWHLTSRGCATSGWWRVSWPLPKWPVVPSLLLVDDLLQHWLLKLENHIFPDKICELFHANPFFFFSRFFSTGAKVMLRKADGLQLHAVSQIKSRTQILYLACLPKPSTTLLWIKKALFSFYFMLNFGNFHTIYLDGIHSYLYLPLLTPFSVMYSLNYVIIWPIESDLCPQMSIPVGPSTRPLRVPSL